MVNQIEAREEPLTLDSLVNKLKNDLELHTTHETGIDELRESVKALLVFSIDALTRCGVTGKCG